LPVLPGAKHFSAGKRAVSSASWRGGDIGVVAALGYRREPVGFKVDLEGADINWDPGGLRQGSLRRQPTRHSGMTGGTNEGMHAGMHMFCSIGYWPLRICREGVP